MIKSLLDADENPPPDTKVIVEETIIQPRAAETAFTAEQLAEAEDILEIAAPRRIESDAQIFGGAQNAVVEKTTPLVDANLQTAAAENSAAPTPQSNGFDDEAASRTKDEAPIFQAAFTPETQAETMRKSGLAYAAAITLFGAVVFMMILGWGFDLLFGSKPWGVVGGIVIGALIGFVQFFRLSSQIFKQ